MVVFFLFVCFLRSMSEAIPKSGLNFKTVLNSDHTPRCSEGLCVVNCKTCMRLPQ